MDKDAVAARLASQCALGRFDEQRETLRSYAARLADELGVEPSARVRDLCREPDHDDLGLRHEGALGEHRPQVPAGAADAPPAQLSNGCVGCRRELHELVACSSAPSAGC